MRSRGWVVGVTEATIGMSWGSHNYSSPRKVLEGWLRICLMKPWINMAGITERTTL